jgi:pimeloyl-ACP methyl ester carboxylesterase
MSLALESIQVQARGLSFPAFACGQGPLVLCLHGFPDTHYSFRHQLRAFAQAGYRAVAPALRGYAPSCLPEPASCNAWEASLDALAIVEALGETSAHLVGHDWGAVIAYLAAGQAPSTWRSVTAMAVPHPLGILSNLRHFPGQLRHSWYMAFFQARGVAERAVRARNFALLKRLWRTWSPHYRASPDEWEALTQALRAEGVLEGALAYYRALFDVTGTTVKKAMLFLRKRIDVPVLALTGEEDGCMDTRLYDVAMDERWFSDVVIERMTGVGHFLHLEEPARVSERILTWMRDHA